MTNPTIPQRAQFIKAILASLFDIDQWESYLVGGDAFVPKPVDIDKLLTELDTALQFTWQYKESISSHKADHGVLNELIVPPPRAELKALYKFKSGI